MARDREQEAREYRADMERIQKDNRERRQAEPAAELERARKAGKD